MKLIPHISLVFNGQCEAALELYAQCLGGTIAYKLTAAAERIFQTLAENGRVQMPLQETFWAARFAALVDRFGIPWIINCEKT